MGRTSTGRHRTSLLAAALCLGPAGAALGEENRIGLHFELGPLLTLVQPRLLNEQELGTPGVHLAVGFEYSPHAQVGLELLYAPDTVYSLVGSAASLQQHIAAGLRVRPWYTSGYVLPRDDEPLEARRFFSDVWIDVHAGAAFATTNYFALDAGVGTRVPVIWPLQLGVYVRYQHLFSVSRGVEGIYGQLTAGVEISLGFLPISRPPDGDRDGVPDTADRCPDSPPGARVNSRGCPMAENAPPTRCSDTDLDGVCDGDDECPETPLSTKVDRHGCPLEEQ